MPPPLNGRNLSLRFGSQVYLGLIKIILFGKSRLPSEVCCLELETERHIRAQTDLNNTFNTITEQLPTINQQLDVATVIITRRLHESS